MNIIKQLEWTRDTCFTVEKFENILKRQMDIHSMVPSIYAFKDEKKTVLYIFMSIYLCHKYTVICMGMIYTVVASNVIDKFLETLTLSKTTYNKTNFTIAN